MTCQSNTLGIHSSACDSLSPPIHGGEYLVGRDTRASQFNESTGGVLTFLGTNPSALHFEIAFSFKTTRKTGPLLHTGQKG